MKISEILGMAVISIGDAAKVGEIQDVVLDPDSERIVSFMVKMPSSKTASVLTVDSVHKVGRDAVTIPNVESIQPQQPGVPQAGVAFRKLRGTRAVTHSGDVLGSIREVEFVPSTFEINSYELDVGPFSRVFGNRKKVPSSHRLHYGRGILMVGEGGEGVESPAEAEETARQDRGTRT